MTKEEIENRIQDLPDYLVPEVADYIDFLISKYGSEKEVQEKELTFEWEGELSHLSNKFSSVDLQHKSKEWR